MYINDSNSEAHQRMLQRFLGFEIKWAAVLIMAFFIGLSPEPSPYAQESDVEYKVVTIKPTEDLIFSPANQNSNQPPIDVASKEPPIDEFVYNFLTYDPTLKQQYLDEIHKHNQQGLAKALNDRLKIAWEAYSFTCNNCAEGDDGCPQRAADRYNMERRTWQFDFEQLKADDEIKYRVACSKARVEEDQYQKNLEEEKKQRDDEKKKIDKKIADNAKILRDEERQLHEKQVDYYRSRLQDPGQNNNDNSVLKQIEDFAAISKDNSGQMVIPPEQFYPSRRKWESHETLENRSREYSRISAVVNNDTMTNSGNIFNDRMNRNYQYKTVLSFDDSLAWLQHNIELLEELCQPSGNDSLIIMKLENMRQARELLLSQGKDGRDK
ncbi:MAG: hypothetical protein NT002_00925 [candidate division Zixibacteria bacterium]|nr:hypothetical protein [candidate division Zixibacteria bacterium]